MIQTICWQYKINLLYNSYNLIFVVFFISYCMMGDFGVPSFVLSKFRKSTLLKWESVTNPNHFYFFQKNKSTRLSDGSVTDSYQCRNCDKLGRVKGRTKIRNNRIIQNPEAGHNDQCAPMNEIEAETIVLKRNMIKKAENGTTPIAAYRESINEIPVRVNNPEIVEGLELASPTFQSIRSSLYR